MKKLISLSIILTLCAPVYAGDTSNMEGAWLLNETSGTRVDQDDNGNDLTDNNTVTSGTGQFGNAADFESTNSEYLSITDGSQTGLDITSDLTMGCFFNAESTGVNRQILAKYDTTGDQRAYRLFVASGDILRISGSTDGTAGGQTQLDGQTTINASTWYHAVMLHDNGTDIDVYLNGSSDSAAPAAYTGGLFNSSADFRIGSRGDTSEFMDGLVDECFIFSRLLADAEINDIRNNGLESFLGLTGRRRSIIMLGFVMIPVQFFNNNYMINKHRKKFDIPRPNWMKFFDLFDIPEAYAAPSAADTAAANSEFNTRDTYQGTYYSSNSKYEQKMPAILSGITYKTHVYEGPQGHGSVHIAEKTEGETLYRFERHTGPETNRVIRTAWTEIIQED